MDKFEKTKVRIKKVHDILFEEICDIDDFCRERGIRYYLSGGTCLGAVRHHDFIPWDSDADVMMPRKDYMRFLKEFHEAYPEKYEVLSLYTSPKWNWAAAKVQSIRNKVKVLFEDGTSGIWIDVIPIDGLPKGKLKQWYFEIKIRCLKAIRNSAMRTEFTEMERYVSLRKLIRRFTRNKDMRPMAQKLDQCAMKYDFEISEYVGASLAGHYGTKEIIQKSDMDHAVYIRFRDRQLPVPVGYDHYLSKLYGEYMKVPKDMEKNGYASFDYWDIEFEAE